MITSIMSLKGEEGFWFYNKNVATYITGTHYMYLQWSKIDVGQPDFRESNRLFYIFWEACKADQGLTECVILRTDDLDSLYGIRRDALIMATISSRFKVWHII